MSRPPQNSVLAYLQQVVGATTETESSLNDGELLKRFLEADEAAFQLLLRRHGPLVLATCQRILRDAHEAEDCFQATFIVLARKAPSIRNEHSVASWLYRVAYHIAINARARLIKQRAQEQEVRLMLRPQTTDPEPCPELPGILDDELRQLPDKYREPLVLCYLEGKTHQQAAQELAWPLGTMSRRVARALELLRHRLLRRGLVLSSAAVGPALTAAMSHAAVPIALREATAKVAVAAVWGSGATTSLGSAKVAYLASESLRQMALGKILTGLLVLVSAVGLLSATAIVFWLQAGAPEKADTTVRPATALKPSRDWGNPVHGLRLRCSCDRLVYRQNQDLIRVGFALHNVSAEPQYTMLEADNREFTDLRITDSAGKEYFVPGKEVPGVSVASRGGHLPPDAIERVSMIFDPSRIEGGLQPGQYRLRGLFRRQPHRNSPLTLPDLRLESNETSFTLVAPRVALASGPEADGCTLSLIAERTTWKPGDPPLMFSVVLNRHKEDLRTLRFLEANGLGLFYSLEITDPSGGVVRSLQPAESRGVDPKIDRLASSRLLFLQLERIPVGKSLGEHIAWDPAGEGNHPYPLEEQIRTLPAAPGRHTVRVVFRLRNDTQQQFGRHPDIVRLVANLVSNPVEVDVGR